MFDNARRAQPKADATMIAVLLAVVVAGVCALDDKRAVLPPGLPSEFVSLFVAAHAAVQRVGLLCNC